ncbi:hypothetical protein ACFVAE_00265 [Microbacterium sp. NPDC057659]|uniref:hypothetical protein n=1 Tax=Microbacterium sp. NPDC057659 TaxID=3346198 RepID=UPI00366BDFDF
MGISTLRALSPADERAGEVLRLRREIGRMQRVRSDEKVLPVPPALEQILPAGGLAAGTVYSVSPSLSLIFALLSASSQRGSWCAAVGLPDLGVEAAAAAGIDLERLVLVPDPGPRWLAVVSALAEIIPLIAVHPVSAPQDAEAARLAARLRDRGCTVLATSPWSQSEGLISIHDPQWEGLGEGWGLLEDRTVTVTAQTRTRPRPQSVRVRLPGRFGVVEQVEQAAPAPIPIDTRWAAAG